MAINKDDNYFGSLQVSAKVNSEIKKLFNNIRKKENLFVDYAVDEALRLFIQARGIKLPPPPKKVMLV